MSYSVFAKYYDESMGDMSGKVGFLKELILQYAPETRSILEFASGTGAILQGLSANYEVAGVELSPDMLELAKEKLPSVDMRLGDMTSFQFGRSFDAVLCVFDSINHLLIWDEWERLFKNAFNHLNSGGVFIFDINTLERLRWLEDQSKSFFNKPNDDAIRMKVTEKEGIFSWNIDISTIEAGAPVMYQEIINEVSFPVNQITEAISNIFSIKAVVDAKGLSKDNPNWRPFFVCQKLS